MTIENSIGTWSGEKQKKTYRLVCKDGTTYAECKKTHTNYHVDQPYGIFSRDRLDGDKNARGKILGSIAYLTSSDVFKPADLFVMTSMDSVEYENNVAYIEPGKHSNKRTFRLGGPSGAKKLIAKNLTGIAGKGASISSSWQTSNISEGSTISSVGNIFTSPDGAQICKRYKDGKLTNESLWPWPMNQRILDATTQSGSTPVDVTQTIERLFGPIPDKCKTNIQGSAQLDSPNNLRIVGQ